MPVLWRQRLQEEEMRCSFCHKSQSAVGRLAYICDECVTVCSQVIEDTEDPIQGNPLIDEFLDAAEQWIACERQGQDESGQLSRMRYIARLMFPDQSEVE